MLQQIDQLLAFLGHEQRDTIPNMIIRYFACHLYQVKKSELEI